MDRGKKKQIIAAGLSLFFLFVVGSLCQAGKFTDYTADQVTMNSSGKIEHQGKLYSSGDKMRMDGFMPESGFDLIMILRRDLKKQFMINTEKKTYVENPLDEKQMEGAFGQNIKSRSEKILGEETVNGYACTKKEIETEIEVMGMKRKTRSIVWQSPQFDMPLRIRDDRGHVTEMRNIKEAKPAASLFEVPNDYKKVANIMELMGESLDSDEDEAENEPSGPDEGGFKIPSQLPGGLKLPFPKK